MNRNKGPRKAPKLSRNPFLNFLRHYRAKNTGLSAIKAAVDGASCWNKMSTFQQEQFRQSGQASKPRREPSKSRSRSGSRSSAKSGSRTRTPSSDNSTTRTHDTSRSKSPTSTNSSRSFFRSPSELSPPE